MFTWIDVKKLTLIPSTRFETCSSFHLVLSTPILTPEPSRSENETSDSAAICSSQREEVQAIFRHARDEDVEERWGTVSESQHMKSGSLRKQLAKVLGGGGRWER